MSFFRFLSTSGKSFFSYLLVIFLGLFSSFEVSKEPEYQEEKNGVLYQHFLYEVSLSKDVLDVNWFHVLRQIMAVYFRAQLNREVKLVIDLIRNRGVVDGYPRDTFVNEKLTEEHEAYLSTVLSDLSHLKYGFWVDKQSKTYFYETGSQVHDCLEFYTLLYKGTCYHVTTEYLTCSREYYKRVMIPSTNQQGEDVYQEIKTVVTEIFRCMYGYSVNLCFNGMVDTITIM